MKKKMLAVLCAAAATMHASLVYAAETESVKDGNTDDGYYYLEFEPEEAGTHQFTTGANGSFSVQWDGINNYRAEFGKKMPENTTVAGLDDYSLMYAGSAELRGNSYYGVHGHFGQIHRDVYIVEGWGSWRPPGTAEQLGRSVVNGKTYSYYALHRFNVPGVDGVGNIRENWVVANESGVSENKKKEIAGTVSFTQHVREITILSNEDTVLFRAGLDYVTMFAEGYGGSAGDSCCTFSVDSLKLYSLPGTETEAYPREADENGFFFREEYEDGTGKAVTAPGASVENTKTYYAEGTGALKVTDRPTCWSGATVSLDDYALKPDTPYCFQTALMQDTRDEALFRLVMLTEQDGSYRVLATAVAKKNTWTVLTCPEFEIPGNAYPENDEAVGKLFLEVVDPADETATDNTDDYFLDCTSLSLGNVRPAISLASCEPPLPKETQTAGTEEQQEYNQNGDGLKDLFGQYFCIGAKIDERYLQTAAMQNSIRKHFNSLSCASGLDPVSAVKAVEGTNVSVDLSKAERVLKFAEQSRIPLRGTSFIGSGTEHQLPDAMLADSPSAEECNARIDSLIQNTFTELKYQYPNLALDAYDVFSFSVKKPTDGFSFGSSLSTVYGENIDACMMQAFRSARKYAPSRCKLYLNDADADFPESADEICAAVRKIMQEGDYIDGVSLQPVVRSDTDLNAYGSALKKIAALGMDIQFADVRVSGSDYKGNSAAQLWVNFFAMAADHADQISCVTLGRPVNFGEYFDEMPGSLFGYDATAGVPVPSEGVRGITEMLKSRKDKIGDADCDGNVDVADAVLVLRYTVSDAEAVISEQGIKNADVDKNGNTDSKDGENILKYIARKITLPVTEPEVGYQPTVNP